MPSFKVGMCCGLGEINGLAFSGSPETSLIQLFSNTSKSNAYDGNIVWFTPIIIFTGGIYNAKEPPPYTENFSRYITENDLGVVNRQPAVENHSNGYLTAYVWLVNKDNLIAWWDKRKPEPVVPVPAPLPATIINKPSRIDYYSLIDGEVIHAKR